MVTRVRSIANISSTYIRQIVTVIVGLLVTRILVKTLGLDVYGSVYFLIQLGAIVDIIGNALSGAAARYVTQSIARGERQQASSYLTNTVYAVGTLGMLFLIAFNIYWFFLPSLNARVPLLLTNLVILSLVITSLGKSLSVGNFIRERFVSRAVVDILGRIVYLGTIFWFISGLDIGIWAVGWSLLITSIVAITANYCLCRYLLPEVVFNLRLISRGQILEIATFVSWMLLAYCGLYVTRSGVLIAIEHSCSEFDLGRFALVFQVNAMVLNVLQTFSLVAAPGVYRSLALGMNRSATAGMERYLLRVTLIGTVATIAVGLEGESILRLWLGNSAPSDMRVLLIGASFSALMLGWGIGVSVYLAGANRVRNYGVLCLSASLAVVLAAHLLLTANPGNLVYVAFLPGIAEATKCLLSIFLIDRYLFVLAPRGAYLRKCSQVLLVMILSFACWFVATSVVPGDKWWQVIFHCVVIGLPLAGYAAWKLSSSQRQTVRIALTSEPDIDRREFEHVSQTS
ncbi:MAG: MATE family efflux transporter [Pirellulaceae bacterium]